MASTSAKHQSMDGLLRLLFADAAQLQRFLEDALGRSFVDDLPATRVSLNEYLHDSLLKLEGRDLIDREFFQALARARPRRFSEVCEAARTFGVAPPERPAEPPRGRAQTAALRTQMARTVPLGSRLPLPARTRVVRSARGTADVLRTGKLSPPQTDNPASLLNARFTVVPFHRGLRDDELTALQSWCDGDAQVAVLVLAGPGGVGKTRLVLELCDRVAAAGFTAGFIHQQASREALDGLLGFDGKALAVVDYAETRPELAEWLERAATIAPGPAQRLRIVLVVRALTDWWDALTSHSSSELSALLRRDPPLRLSAEALPLAERARVFAEALAHFAGLRGVDVPATAPPDLDGPLFGKILYLHMAALAAIEDRPPPVEDLLADTLRRERQFWSLRLPGLTSDEARPMLHSLGLGVAAVILAGGADSRDHALTLLSRAGVGEALREPLLTRLGDLYPGTGDRANHHAYLSALEPDLLAETHVAEVLLHRSTSSALVTAVFAGASPEAVRPALALLGRLASREVDELTTPRPGLEAALRAALAGLLAEDLPARAPVALDAAVTLAERQLRCPLAELLAEALRRGGTAALAELLAAHPFSRARALHGVEAWIYQTSLDACPDDDHRRRFTSLIRLGGVELAQGQRDRARQRMADAVAASRLWIAEEPEAMWPSLMGAGLLGLTTGEVGEHEEAVATARETLQRCELLEPEATGEDEQLILLIRMMYGIAQFRSGARGEAIAVFSAMQPRYERLAARDALPERALCDFYLGICLNETGHHEAAVQALTRAAAIQRELVAQQRGSHLESLAWTLIFQCEATGRISAASDALRIGDEAVALWESLAVLADEAARPGLALALSAAATARLNGGDQAGAVAAASRAVDLLRELVRRQPLAFTAQMAAALGSLGNVLREPAEAPAALAAFDEALALIRPFALRSPAAYGPILGRTQLLRGLRTMASETNEAAVADLQASLETYRGLPDDVAAGFILEWGLAAAMLGMLHIDHDQETAAVAALSESLAVLERAPAGEGPLHEFVRALALLARGMLRAGEEDAEHDLASGLPALRRMAATAREVRYLLAFTLSCLARTAGAREDLAAAEAALRESIAIYRDCIADGEPHTGELADDLCLLALLHQGRGQGGAARKLLLAAEACYRGLPAAELRAYRDDFAGCLADLADLETDRRRKLQRSQEAVQVCLELFADDPEDPADQLERLIDLGRGLARLGRGGEARAAIAAGVARALELKSDRDDELPPILAEAQALLARLPA